MHVSILGASSFGVATARHLVEEGHDVVLIDANREKLDALSDGLDCAMLCGDGTLPSTLRDAFGDGSDALVALTNEDDVNILAAVVARSVGYTRVIPQIVRSEMMSVVKELRLDDVITPHESLARSIVSGLTEHSEVETGLVLRRELRIVNHTVPETLAGQALGDLELPHDASAFAVAAKAEDVVATQETRLAAGDRVLFVVKCDAADALTKLFEGEG